MLTFKFGDTEKYQSFYYVVYCKSGGHKNCKKKTKTDRKTNCL